MPRTKQKLTVSELRVGIFILAALLVFGFLILNSSGDFNPFERKLRLKARFVSADGLHKNADVQLAGVSIGRVEDVKFLPPDSSDPERIEATFAVAKELDRKPITDLIRSDSTAQLVTTTVLGNDKIINIIPGTSKGSPVTENATLQSDSAISLNQLTSTGNDLLKQINKLAIPASEILNKANQGDGTFGRLVNDESLYKNLDNAVVETRATMTRLQTALNKINSGQGSAGKLINDPALYDNLNKTVTELEAISSQIKSGKGSAGKLVNDDALYVETRNAVAELKTTASKLSSIADDIKLITTDLKDGKGSAGKLLKDEKFYDDTVQAIAKFNSTATRLDAMLADAQAGKGTFGKLVTDETLYNSLNQTSSNINQFSSEGTKLLYDFRQNPKKFLRIKLALF